MTPPSTVNISGFTTVVHSLPPSHLPIIKYVSVNRGDAIDVHRYLCIGKSSVWYADGSSRAGEGWSAAVEWILDAGQSGSKMRGCVGDGDSLDAELGGICKAVEGFRELLQKSIKDAKPISHELVVFSDSPAAIVSLDTSSRPEAIRFEEMWREICSEFLQASLVLAWLPRESTLEGLVLADKIAVVGASNAYLKRKKEGGLTEEYRRPGGGEPAPPGSAQPGAWQKGDAEPKRIKKRFERTRPRLVTPPLDGDSGLGLALDGDTSADNADDLPPVQSKPAVTQPIIEGFSPKEGTVFVTQ